jgi:mevalonate kinase
MYKKFNANGKLLITGEYFVIDGAKALALPTHFGQSLRIQEDKNQGNFIWKSFDEQSPKITHESTIHKKDDL